MASQEYKTNGKKGLFAEQFTLERLSEISNPVDKIIKVIDFESFCNSSESKLLKTEMENRIAAKHFGGLKIFKIISLQYFYEFSDNSVEFRMIDSLSFKKFLSLESGDKEPNEKAVWRFKENLTNSGIEESLFNQFKQFLEDKHLIFNKGKLIDVGFAGTPCQRNMHEDSEKIKKGEGNGLWNDQARRKKHKDIHARWTKKNSKKYFGYMDHAEVDYSSKFIKRFEITDVSVHGSQPLNDLPDKSDKGQLLHEGSANAGEKLKNVLCY